MAHSLQCSRKSDNTSLSIEFSNTSKNDEERIFPCYKHQSYAYIPYIQFENPSFFHNNAYWSDDFDGY